MNAQVKVGEALDPLSAFEDLSLDPSAFNHRRHLELGWRYLQRYGFPDGAARFAARLRAYVAHVGASAKYHETITWAYLVLMNEERVLRSPCDETFDDMIARRADLLDHRNGALARVYSKEELDRADARAVFVMPRSA